MEIFDLVPTNGRKSFGGKAKKVLLGKQNQLRKGTKTIIINKEAFIIDWSKFKN